MSFDPPLYLAGPLREPKQMLCFEGTHEQLPAEAFEAIWLFLKRHLF